jgi:hypothetical protein
MIYSLIGGGLVLLYLLILWAWYGHCFFFFHVWDTHRELSDVCLRCGAIRFK